MLSVGRLIALGAMVALAMPAAAQMSKAKGDANEVICEKQEVLGSRLAVKRVCKTRAEWTEQRRADRDLVQNSQLGVRQKNPCNRNGC